MNPILATQTGPKWTDINRFIGDLGGCRRNKNGFTRGTYNKKGSLSIAHAAAFFLIGA